MNNCFWNFSVSLNVFQELISNVQSQKTSCLVTFKIKSKSTFFSNSRSKPTSHPWGPRQLKMWRTCAMSVTHSSVDGDGGRLLLGVVTRLLRLLHQCLRRFLHGVSCNLEIVNKKEFFLRIHVLYIISVMHTSCHEIFVNIESMSPRIHSPRPQGTHKPNWAFG